MRSTLPLLLLAGCPYLFDPPDLSNVGGDASDAPRVVDFSVRPRSDSVVAHFALADRNADLVGGSIDLSDGSKHYVLSIPGDIDDWQPLGTSTVALYRGPWLDCSTAVSETWTLAPTDLAGHVGEPASADLFVTALGQIPETAKPNVWPTDGASIPTPPPLMGCTSWETDPEDLRPPLDQLRTDVEALYFTAPERTKYVVELWWSTACDVDLTIYPYPLSDDDLDGYYDTIATSWSFGNVPELADFKAVAGTTYFVDFDFFEPLQRQSPPFVATFLVTPE